MNPVFQRGRHCCLDLELSFIALLKKEEFPNFRTSVSGGSVQDVTFHFLAFTKILRSKFEPSINFWVSFAWNTKLDVIIAHVDNFRKI